MKKHSDYVTHINNTEDYPYLRKELFPVNMRLFNSSPEYKAIIKQQCEYIRQCCLDTKEGYSKPYGMSAANLGLSFNIIGITINRNKHDEYCLIMINPSYLPIEEDGQVDAISNCGSITLDKPITIKRWKSVEVTYYDEDGKECHTTYSHLSGGKTAQHEIDHNLGILITDYLLEK